MGDNKSAQQPDVNEQIKVRMEKLKNLQDAGKDPFQITKYDVTHHTDEIRAIYEAHEKELLGDRPAVNTEGLDEQQAREAVTADYNERRAIMDASPINVSFCGIKESRNRGYSIKDCRKRSTRERIKRINKKIGHYRIG